jgi:hypothetical protein
MRAHLVLISIIAALLNSFLQAQSIEDVLNALQERKQMLVMRGVIAATLAKEADSIVYNGELDYSDISFPSNELIKWKNDAQDATQTIYFGENKITNLSHAIALLNQASFEFDLMKSEFLAYSGDSSTIVNQQLVAVADFYDPVLESVDRERPPAHASIAYPSITLPSVGVFTPENWRQKIKVLGSNIDQLKAMPWPAQVVSGEHSWDGSKTGVIADYVSEYASKNDNAVFKWREPSFKYPWIFDPFPHGPKNPLNFDNHMREGLSMHAWSHVNDGSLGRSHRTYYGKPAYYWTAGLGYRKDKIDANVAGQPPQSAFGTYDHRFGGVVALKTQLAPPEDIQLPEHLRSIQGTLNLFRNPRISAWGDLTSSAIPNPGATLVQASQGSLTINDLANYDHKDGYLKDAYGQEYSWLTVVPVQQWLGAWRMPTLELEGSWGAPIIRSTLPGAAKLNEWSGSNEVYLLKQKGEQGASVPLVPQYRTAFRLDYGDGTSANSKFLISRYAYQADGFVFAVPNFRFITPE